MTKEYFFRALKLNNIDCTYVRFNDSTSDDVFCICERNGMFDVFYRERGQEWDKQTFVVFKDAVDSLACRLALPNNTGDGSMCDIGR